MEILEYHLGVKLTLEKYAKTMEFYDKTNLNKIDTVVKKYS